MSLKPSHLWKRLVCAASAVTLLVTIAAPTAFAADGAAAPETSDTLTQADAAQMAEADAAVDALVNSDSYADMGIDQRQQAARDQLDDLADEGLVQRDSIYYDEENGMYSFTYTCGVLGGILLTDWEDEDETMVQVPLEVPEELAGSPLDQQNDALPLGNAIIYYAFDDTVNSSRYPNYLVMQQNWTNWGLNTTLDTEVTIQDLKQMYDYDICILSTHGAYYTYNTGWLFRRMSTSPVLILREESSFWNDLRYGIDLLTHRVIKVNGFYCVTPDFFSATYRGGKLNGNLIFSESCEFFGGNNDLNLSMSQALLDGGASAVVGFVNNVYTIYSRDMLWGTVNQLIMGKNILQAVDAAAATYGDDDIEWYLSQGGTNPHRYASFALVHGSDSAVLYDLADSSAAA